MKNLYIIIFSMFSLTLLGQTYNASDPWGKNYTMKKNHYIFLLTLLLFVISCKKNDCANPNVVDGINTTELPPATMTGANTMGCLINGEVWLPLKKNILGNLEYNISFTVTGPAEGGALSSSKKKI